MDDLVNYEPPAYEPPHMVEMVGAFLQAPRNRHTTTFADVLSPYREVQRDYVHGLLTVGIIFAAVFVFWTFVLIVLKLKGSEVGCASGRAFQKPSSDQLSSVLSTDSESFHSSSYNDDSVQNGYEMQSLDRVLDADRSLRSDFRSDQDSFSDYDSRDGWVPSTGTISRQRRVSRRETRTRFAFLVFSFIALVTVPFILVFSFSPIKDATRRSDDIILATKDALGQIQASVNTIESARLSSIDIVKWTPVDLSLVCPNVDPDQLELVLGFDLRDLATIISDEFPVINEAVKQNTTTVQKMLSRIDTSLTDFEAYVDKAEDFMWIVPGLLFAVSMLASITMLGVLLAWREKSGKCFQRTMSYVTLPLLLVVTLMCWALVISSAFGAMITYDACTAGTSPGSPDNTVQQVIAAHKLHKDDTLFKLVNAYTNQCTGSNPTEDVAELERIVQSNIDLIWRQISTVDSIGRATLIDKCGGDRLSDLLSGARNLAKLLTAVRRALDSASGTLECQRINPIYVEAAHNALCTDIASGTAYGFTLFFVLAICTMAMVSLRASWLRNIVEEKVYHDESEVAENMILDEHEEYLAYISKYKHEWQEYRGFDSSTLGRRSEEDSFYEDEGSEGSIYFEDSGRPSLSRFGDDGSRTDGEGYNGSDECSTGNAPASGKWVGLDTEVISGPLVKGPSIDDGAKCGVSIAADDISFPSLPVNHSDESSIDEDELFVLPSLLHPPPENPDFRDDDRQIHRKPSVKQTKIHDSGDMEEGKVRLNRGPGTPDDRYDTASGGENDSKEKKRKQGKATSKGIEVVLTGGRESDVENNALQNDAQAVDEAMPDSKNSDKSHLQRAQSAPKPSTSRMSRAQIKLLAKSFDRSRSRSRSRSNRSNGEC